MTRRRGIVTHLLRETRLSQPDRLVVVKTREAIPPGVGAGLADVDHQDGMPGAVGEELPVDARGVEAAHRSGREAHGPDAKEEIPGLQRGIELRLLLPEGI